MTTPSHNQSPEEHGYESLVDLTDIDTSNDGPAAVDLRALIPTISSRRRALFSRALKYMTYLSGERRR